MIRRFGLNFSERTSPNENTPELAATAGSRPQAQADRVPARLHREDPLTGPDFHSSAVEHGGGTLLWFTDGVADLLEIFSYGDQFPQDHSEVADFSLQDNDAEPGQ